MTRGALVSAALFALTVTPAQADQLIDNVNGITLDAQGKVVYFSGLLIGPDGHVKQLLSSKDKRPKKLDFLHDGKGRTLVPGFAAPRCDLAAIGLGRQMVDLSKATSFDEAMALLAVYAAHNPARRWIIGHGWNARRWAPVHRPTTAALDRVVADRPVWLIDSSGEAGWANSAALRAAGIQSDSIITSDALRTMNAVIPLPRPAEIDQALGDAQQLLLSRGFTMIHQMDADIGDWQALRRAGDEGRLRIRVAVYATSVADMVLIAGQQPTRWLYDGKLRLSGLWQQIDGSVQNRTAWLKQPDTGSVSRDHGKARMGDAELRNVMSRAAMDGFQVVLGAHGDAAVAEAVNAIEELAITYKGDRRWRIAAIDLADTADIARMAPLGIIAEFDPLLPVRDGALAEAIPGAERVGQSWPGRALATGAAGVMLGGNCGPAVPDPLAAFAAAITRADEYGRPFGGWQGQERLSREQALAALTLTPARAAIADAQVGTLLPGKQADFVLLDTDPMLANPADIWKAKVTESWVGGKRLFVTDAKAASPAALP